MTVPELNCQCTTPAQIQTQPPQTSWEPPRCSGRSNGQVCFVMRLSTIPLPLTGVLLSHHSPVLLQFYGLDALQTWLPFLGLCSFLWHRSGACSGCRLDLLPIDFFHSLCHHPIPQRVCVDRWHWRGWRGRRHSLWRHGLLCSKIRCRTALLSEPQRLQNKTIVSDHHGSGNVSCKIMEIRIP